MNRTGFFLIFFVLCINFCYSQEETPAPLKQILEDLESRFDVKFSYGVETIDVVSVGYRSDFQDLDQALDFLRTQTDLVFRKVDDRFITIAKADNSHTFCAVVKDYDTGLFLQGASVRILNSSNGLTTGSQGQFTLENASLTDFIEITYLGYSGLTLSLRELNTPDGKCPVVYLQEIESNLSEIIITKFLTTGLQKTKDGKLILNTEKFGILPGLTEPDILQTIQVLPGVESVDESIANINVRGGNNDENLMLWDDIVMYHSGHFFGLISAYNPYLTERVEVSKNGASSEYGGGVSSVINMTTKNQVSEEISGGAGINGLSADLFLQVPLSDKLAFHISGRRSIADGVLTPTYEEYFRRSFQDSEINSQNDQNLEVTTNSDFTFYDFSGKLLYDFSEKHKIRVTFIGINNELNYGENILSNSQQEDRESRLVQNNNAFGANWTANWTSKFSTYVNTYYTKYNIDSDERNIGTDQLLTQQNEVLETGLKIKGDYVFNPVIRWRSGYQFTETGIRNGTTVSNPFFIQRRKEVLLSQSLFNDLIFENPNLYLRAGARLTYFDKFNNFRIEPRLNMRQAITPQMALKLEGELKYQTATQIRDFEDDFLGVENRRWILANNEDIPLIRSQQVSAGIDFRQNNWLIDLTAFYKNVEGITASNQGFQNQFQFIRTSGDYNIHGVEFLINKSTERSSTWLTYTFAKNDYFFEELEPSDFPNNTDIRHSLTLGSSYDIFETLKISAGLSYRTGRPFTPLAEGPETLRSGNRRIVNFDLPNSENLEDYFRLDVSAAYDFKIGKSSSGKITLGVLNLTDRENTILRYYKIDPLDEENALEVNNRSLGLTPNLSLRFYF